MLFSQPTKLTQNRLLDVWCSWVYRLVTCGVESTLCGSNWWLSLLHEKPSSSVLTPCYKTLNSISSTIYHWHKKKETEMSQMNRIPQISRKDWGNQILLMGCQISFWLLHHYERQWHSVERSDKRETMTRQRQYTIWHDLEDHLHRIQKIAEENHYIELLVLVKLRDCLDAGSFKKSCPVIGLMCSPYNREHCIQNKQLPLRTDNYLSWNFLQSLTEFR